MNPEYQQYEKQFQITRFVAFAMLVLAPIVFVVITYIAEPTGELGEGTTFVFYALLVVALVAPSVYLFVERVQVANYIKNPKSEMSPAQLFTSLTVNKCAFVEEAFLFGLVMFFLTADRTYMWYFYAIGAAWAAVYWPTEGKFEEFMKKVQVRNA